jgi:hypothetical protein
MLLLYRVRRLDVGCCPTVRGLVAQIVAQTVKPS